MKKLFTLSLLALGVICCQSQKVDQKAEAEKLMNLSREWAKVAGTGDTEKILSYWAKDAVVMSPGQQSVVGQDALRQMLVGSFKIPGFEINWEPKEAYVSESGDVGYVIAHSYVILNDSLGNPYTTFNRGVEIWKKQDDGSWKNVVDIFSQDPTLKSIK